ncbi:MAG: hypothetical protein ACFB0E_12420 [Leptolyngbyaceae cyanobacterium]
MSGIAKSSTITNLGNRLPQSPISLLSIVSDRDFTDPGEPAFFAALLPRLDVQHRLATITESAPAFRELWARSPAVLLIALQYQQTVYLAQSRPTLLLTKLLAAKLTRRQAPEIQAVAASSHSPKTT